MNFHRKALMTKHYINDENDKEAFKNSDLTYYLCINCPKIFNLDFIENFNNIKSLEIRRSNIKDFSKLKNISLEDLVINSDNFSLNYFKPKILSKIRLLDLKISDKVFLNRNYFGETRNLYLNFTNLEKSMRISSRFKNIKNFEIKNDSNKTIILKNLPKYSTTIKIENFNLKSNLNLNCKNLVLINCKVDRHQNIGKNLEFLFSNKKIAFSFHRNKNLETLIMTQ